MNNTVSALRFTGALQVTGNIPERIKIQEQLQKVAKSNHINLSISEGSKVSRFYTQEDSTIFEQNEQNIETFLQMDEDALANEQNLFKQLVSAERFLPALRKPFNELLATVAYRKMASADDVLQSIFGLANAKDGGRVWSPKDLGIDAKNPDLTEETAKNMLFNA